MPPLSRSGFWLSAVTGTVLLVLMLVLMFGTSSFGSESTNGAGEQTGPVKVTCYSVTNAVARGPRGFRVAGTYRNTDEPAWGVHCANIRSERTGWLALLAVPTAVLAALCLIRRPEELIGRPRPKPKLGPLFTPSIE